MSIAEGIEHSTTLPWKRRLRPYLKPKIIFGGTVVVALLVIGLFAPALSPFDPNRQDLNATMLPPQWLSGVTC